MVSLLSSSGVASDQRIRAGYSEVPGEELKGLVQIVDNVGNLVGTGIG
jgi:hypothetical protein